MTVPWYAMAGGLQPKNCPDVVAIPGVCFAVLSLQSHLLFVFCSAVFAIPCVCLRGAVFTILFIDCVLQCCFGNPMCVLRGAVSAISLCLTVLSWQSHLCFAVLSLQSHLFVFCSAVFAIPFVSSVCSAVFAIPFVSFAVLSLCNPICVLQCCLCNPFCVFAGAKCCCVICYFPAYTHVAHRNVLGVAMSVFVLFGEV